MKILSYIFLFLLVSINTLETTGYKLLLNNAERTLDGTPLSTIEVNGVTYIGSSI